jgi:two-component system response regulator RegA
MEAVRQGAWDYLTKPADADQILAALSRDPSQPQNKSEITPSSLDRLEWEHIQRVLNDNDGNVTQTAIVLGMHRRSLQRKLRKDPPQT